MKQNLNIILGEIEKLASQIGQIRMLHPHRESLVDENKDWCAHCDEYWPCQTIKIIGEK